MTLEEAETQLLVKVYAVADLVLPISGGVGANPFSRGGGLGGAGGFGGGKGGAGGMMGGMGGGGGVFRVEDTLFLGGKKAREAGQANGPRRRVISLESN